jgi:hypothetical protein
MKDTRNILTVVTYSLLMEVVKEKLQTLLQFWEEIQECIFVFKTFVFKLSSNWSVYNKKTLTWTCLLLRCMPVQT